MFSLKKASKSSQSEMRDIAARICRDYLHGAWKTISAEEIQLKRISGGLSNFLYYVSLPNLSSTNSDDVSANASLTKRPRKETSSRFCSYYDNQNNQYEPKEVLLRIYGQTHGEHALETMLTESVVFTLLSERNLGPKLHGIFPGGRIEQYIPARPLTTSELFDEKISQKIAEKMAVIHSLDIPVSKEPDWIWKTAQRWLISIDNVLNGNNRDDKGSKLPDNQNGPREQMIKKFRDIDLNYELQWLNDRVKEEEQQFLVVFAHNDLQEGNILLKESHFDADNSSTFINTTDSVFNDFVESSNRLDSMLLSPEEPFPSRNTRKRTLSAKEEDSRDGGGGDRQLIEDLIDDTHDSVLSGETVISSEDKQDESTLDQAPELMIIDFEYCSYNYRGFDLANHFLEWTFDYTNKEFPFFYHKKNQYPTEEQRRKFVSAYLRTMRNNQRLSMDEFETEFKAIKKEISFFTMASHLFWTLWAIVNCEQEIEFGYWEYASCRIEEYFLAKEAYISTYKKDQSS